MKLLLGMIVSMMMMINAEDVHPHIKSEGEDNSIKSIDIEFMIEDKNYVAIRAEGEPKSGTTWLGRIVPQIVLDLCGNKDNPSCRMGGLKVHPNIPAPYYEFEMVKNEKLFHFFGKDKHVIEGMRENAKEFKKCHMGNFHQNTFANEKPCKDDKNIITRNNLVNCLWDTSSDCVEGVEEKDLTVVITRDPRDVILSERKMRQVYYNDYTKKMSLEEFIFDRFENLVSWIHQRWVWHSQIEIMKKSSHVVYYEDLISLDHGYTGIMGISEFLGLNCSSEIAMNIWDKHRFPGTPKTYLDRGLSQDIVKFMNETMARILPIPLVYRYGLVPVE